VVPDPIARVGNVLIANARSLISAGTEKAAMELAQKSLLGKARERPDQVRRVLEKLKTEGFFRTLVQVRERLDEPMAMGYSSTGVGLACGEGVQEFKPGDRVASNGPHAGVISVPRNLCARVPDGVSFDQAAFTVLGAIALQGMRLARLELGATAYVIGLGLVGQLAVALLKAAGCRVLAMDLDPGKCELAQRLGADEAAPSLTARGVLERTGRLGADAVLIAASARSTAPIDQAVEAVRKKGRVVLVGVVDLNLDRRPWYFKEAEFVVSCSYGPGRYDPAYEECGRDYPPAYVRWTEQRNMQAVLDLMASGRLDVTPLISHRFPIERAQEAYALIEQGTEPYVGILLEYPDSTSEPRRRIEMRPAVAIGGKIGFGMIGAGNFARTVLLPAIEREPRFSPIVLCSAGGLSAVTAGEKRGFQAVTTDEEVICSDPKVQAIFIATRHDQHAAQVVKALKAGKHVFVEKPLCLTPDELHEIASVYESLGDRSQKAEVSSQKAEVSNQLPASSQESEISSQRSEVRATEVSGRGSEVSGQQAEGGGPEPQICNLQSAICNRPILMVGFNRRFSPAARMVHEFFAGAGQPLTTSVRFNAGAIPADHWTQDDSVGGGRIIGEACHAIDLATFLVGAPPIRVYAESVGGTGITDDQCFITLRHSNGAVSSVAYLAGGDRAFPKERVEVLGGGRVAVIEDFRTVTTVADGRTRTKRLGGQDKGHQAEIAAFADAIAGGKPSPIPFADLYAVSLASILAVRSLREGIPFEIPSA
jgi:predicted dehydrogenase/NADPH:quinone reductase-like Zn-dependent oxidoreductase